MYECWLHPAKYRTQLCKEGPNCRRPVCFFAHSVLDLRQPSHSMYAASGGAPPAAAAADDAQGAAVAAALSQQTAAAAAAMAGARLSADASFGRLSSEEMLNNIQGQDSRSPSEVLAALPAAATAAAALLARSPSSRQSSASLTRSSSDTR